MLQRRPWFADLEMHSCRVCHQGCSTAVYKASAPAQDAWNAWCTMPQNCSTNGICRSDFNTYSCASPERSHISGYRHVLPACV